MQRPNAPFALRTRIRQALVLLVILSPLYTYIIIQAPTKPTHKTNSQDQQDSIAIDTTINDSTIVAPFYR